MKVALFSDIHGNITGLKAVLSYIERLRGVDLLFCAGDVLGSPGGTENLLDLLIERNIRMVRGNEDDVLRDIEAHMQYVPEKYRARRIRWAEQLHKKISRPYWDLLASLPVYETVEFGTGHTLIVCHATPDNPHKNVCAPWNSTEDLKKAYGDHDAEVIAYGHFHAHHVIRLNEKLLINVASVGFRQDGMSAFTMLEYRDQHWIVNQFLVPYDVEEEQRLNRESRVPL